ncbi:hypothetical protein [Geosporobacter ferrireducens]|nr:hypothetical protein [Geosporobacter ferrireducens]
MKKRSVGNGIAGARPFLTGRNPPAGGVPHGTLYRKAESVRVGHILHRNI